MRPLIVSMLLLFSLAAIFTAIGAVGVWQMYHQQVAVEPPAQLSAVAEESPVLASARIPHRADDQIAPPDFVGAAAGAPVPPIDPPRFAPLPAGPIDLSALHAVTRGRMIHVEPVEGGYAVTDWRDAGATVTWDLPQRAAGWYTVEVSFACPDNAGGDFVIDCANQTLSGKARPTGRQYRTAALGSVLLPAEQTRLILKADGPVAGTLMNVRQVRLSPAKE
jgi:hypothetical protein